MKKTVRLTEADLTRLVKRVIRESEMNEFGTEVFAQSDDAGENYFDSMDKKSKFKREDFDDHKTFGPEDYDDFMEYINDCDTNWCLKTKKYYDAYAKKGINVGKRFN